MKKIMYILVISVNIFTFVSCSEEKPSTQSTTQITNESSNQNAAKGPTYFYFIFPKTSIEYKKFIENFGSLIKNNAINYKDFVDKYNYTDFIDKANLFTIENGNKKNFFEYYTTPFWLEYKYFSENLEFIRVIINQRQLINNLNLSDKKINIELFLKIGDLVDTINIINASLFNYYDYYIKQDDIKIKGKKLIFIDDLPFNYNEFQEVRDYYWNKYKIPNDLIPGNSFRSPNYYVVDENENKNINGN